MSGDGGAASPAGGWRRGAGANAARDALEGGITAIAAAGCGTPRLDAEILLAEILGVSRERLLIDDSLLVQGPAVRAYRDAVRRRAVLREPVAYILGRRSFRMLELQVDPRALIPRPETELLVEAGLELRRAERVLDVGTGSGAVALALKQERADLLLAGSDCSEPALQLARANATRLGLDVAWHHADLLNGIAGEYDAVLANLPYVPDGDRASLAPEILRHEPAEALFSGPDGLNAIRALLVALAGRPAVRFLALEIGAGQAEVVEALVVEAGFPSGRRLRDLAGIERVIVGERSL